MELPPPGWQTRAFFPETVNWVATPSQDSPLCILTMAKRSLSGSSETSTEDVSAVPGIGAGAGAAAVLAGRAPRMIMATASLRKCIFL